MQKNCYFPILWLIPEFDADLVEEGCFSVLKRKWDVSIFDLYSLVAQKHPIRMPAELLQIFLPQANLEFSILANDITAARDRLDVFRAMLSLQGIHPSISPFAANISLNKYAGINSRSAGNQATMHEGLREGITHKDGQIEMWPNELSFNCIGANNENLKSTLTESLIIRAAKNSEKWLGLEEAQGSIRAARRAFINAPLMPDLGSSILHIWQGIESLFPTVSTEITFRTSLLLAELISPLQNRAETYEASRASYKDRSRIAHGSEKEISLQQWLRAWLLLSRALEAVLDRGLLPNEEELTRGLLGS